MLKENNVRTGFFEREQFDLVRPPLREVRPVVHFAYLTGWRIPSEVLTLLWRQVDFEAATVARTRFHEERRRAGFPSTAELRALLEQQRSVTDHVQREQGRIIPHVFHGQGKWILQFREAWEAACTEAGCPGRRIVHDFRRTAVRNLMRAGIPERVAMTMTGHKTRSVFERYNIVSPGDLRDAGDKLNAAAATNAGTTAEKGALAPAGELG